MPSGSHPPPPPPVLPVVNMPLKVSAGTGTPSALSSRAAAPEGFNRQAIIVKAGKSPS